jgi:hypothetical protein
MIVAVGGLLGVGVGERKAEVHRALAYDQRQVGRGHLLADRPGTPTGIHRRAVGGDRNEVARPAGGGLEHDRHHVTLPDAGEAGRCGVARPHLDLDGLAGGREGTISGAERPREGQRRPGDEVAGCMGVPRCDARECE